MSMVQYSIISNINCQTYFPVGMTCKNLLAPENGDIEYILEENERDDITILQVCIYLIFAKNMYRAFE